MTNNQPQLNKPIEDILANLVNNHSLKLGDKYNQENIDEATQAIKQYIDTEIIGEDVGVSNLAKMDEYWKGQNALRVEQRQRLNKEEK